MTAEYSLEELALSVQEWCAEHRVVPANGQAADEMTERNIRYYRTIGLLDPPLGNYARTFSEKHRLQLIAIRLYQAQGFPLRKIRDELYGKSAEDLEALEKQANKIVRKAVSVAVPFQPALAGETWSTVPLKGDFLLVSRQNRQLPRAIIEKINQLITSAGERRETVNGKKEGSAI